MTSSTGSPSTATWVIARENPSGDKNRVIFAFVSRRMAKTDAAAGHPCARSYARTGRQRHGNEDVVDRVPAGEPEIERLKSVPGVALIVAAAFVSVIDDAKRFTDAHQVEAYLGLVPSEHTSGKRKLGAITKQGNSYMRALLIQSAHCILRLRADDPLKRWGESVEQRRGLKIAVVAVARRLVGILWAIWRDGTRYDITKLGHASARGLSSHAEELKAEAAQMRADVSPTGNRSRAPRAAKRATLSRGVSMT